MNIYFHNETARQRAYKYIPVGSTTAFVASDGDRVVYTDYSLPNTPTAHFGHTNDIEIVSARGSKQPITLVFYFFFLFRVILLYVYVHHCANARMAENPSFYVFAIHNFGRTLKKPP